MVESSQTLAASKSEKRWGRMVAGTTGGKNPGACRADELDMFGDIYRSHLQSVYRVASSLCGSKVAADVTQDVFIEAWRNPEKFDPSRGSLRALLVAMTHHKAVDVIRSESARFGRESRAQPPTRCEQVDGHLIQDELAARVWAALNELPENLREAVVTAFYGQCSYREAALVLGEPQGTIKAHVRKGLSQLQTSLADAL